MNGSKIKLHGEPELPFGITKADLRNEIKQVKEALRKISDLVTKTPGQNPALQNPEVILAPKF